MSANTYCKKEHLIKRNLLFLNNSTIKLLSSSILVSISGALRVYVASLLLSTHPGILTCLAGGLIIYSVYTLDRTLDSEEDKINHAELESSNRKIGFIASGISFLIGSYIFAGKGLLALAFLPFITGLLYSKGIKIGKFALKLKGGLGIKNLITGITWGLSVVGVAGLACKSLLSLVIMFLYFGTKLFVNSTIYDFGDIKGDIQAGIKTLPVCCGELLTKKILFGLHIISHALLYIAITIGIIAFKPLIILYSFLSGLLCIRNYTKTGIKESNLKHVERTVLVDWESTIITGITLIQGIFYA